MMKKHLVSGGASWPSLRLAGSPDGPCTEVQSGCLSDRQIAAVAVDPDGAAISTILHAAHCEGCCRRVAQARSELSFVRRVGRSRAMWSAVRAQLRVAGLVLAGAVVAFVVLQVRDSAGDALGAHLAHKEISKSPVLHSLAPEGPGNWSPGICEPPFARGAGTGTRDSDSVSASATADEDLLAGAFHPKVAPPTRYIVQRGDSLSMIAFRVYRDAGFADALALFNGMSDPNLLEVGAEIRIPARSVVDNIRRNAERPLKAGRAPIYDAAEGSVAAAR